VKNTTTLEIDLTNPATTIEEALSPLVGAPSLLGGDPFIDAECAGDSYLLTRLTTDPGRMPLLDAAWSNAETECFRAYLTRTFMQAQAE
jgi:hypothetical protein